MNKHLCAALLIAGAVACVAADAPSLHDARLRWLKGNYEEALSLYEDLAKDAKLKTDAIVGQSRALESVGEYDKALDVVEAALKDAPKEAPLLARQAELLYLRGRWDDAEKAANAAIDASKPEELAHFLGPLGPRPVYRDRGDMAKADTEFRWFVRTYTERSNKDDDIKDPEELLLVGLAGTENARWHNLSNQFAFILQTLYVDAEKESTSSRSRCGRPSIRPARCCWRSTTSPRRSTPSTRRWPSTPAPPRRWSARARRRCKSSKSSRPMASPTRRSRSTRACPAALLLKADVQLASGDITRRSGRRSKRRWPSTRATSTPWPARPPASRCMQQEGRLRRRRQGGREEQPQAGRLLLRPRRTAGGPPLLRRRRGLLQEGGGAAADAAGAGRHARACSTCAWAGRRRPRRCSTRASTADKFNVRVANTRKVLKHLQGLRDAQDRPFHRCASTRRTTAPWPTTWPTTWNKSTPTLSEKFQYKPKGPILIEVFNNHEMFSGRVVALPDLHTIGACTGRMFAMVSPNGKGARQAVQLGARAAARNGPHLQSGTDQFPDAALVDGGAGRQQRGLSPAAARGTNCCSSACRRTT